MTAKIPTVMIAFVAFLILLPMPFCQAQDDSKYDTSENEVSTSFDDPQKERLYLKVLGKLQGMKFADDSAFADEETNHDVDWFVVGGMLTNKRTGAFNANFATYQGVENVAQKIVEFEHGSFGSNQPAWQVFHRYGGSREADRAKEKVEADFQVYVVKREQEMARRQMAAARARARSRARRSSGGC